ncbi:MAG: hypothetical protein JNJ43_09800 [Anaerolineales bacterium]|nr:hypothetical protein [Anaerolineales bacterium]
MKTKSISIVVIIVFILVSCVPDSIVTPEQPDINTPLIIATEQSPFSRSNIDGIHFSGQGPTTWPIQKDTGMALVHLKVENCGYSLILSAKGQNIPYMPTKVVITDHFDDQYQYINQFQGLPNREETIILDPPILYEDYDSPPHTEMLRIEDVSPDCKWELSILPMSAARKISSGQVLSGMYSDVLAVMSNLSRIELLFMKPNHEEMLQLFGGITAITDDMQFVYLEPIQDTQIYEDIPSRIKYLVVYSKGYWELQSD